MPSAAGAAPLTGMSVTQGNYLVQGLGTVTVGFTTAQPVMPGGYVSVAFPAGYDLSTVVTGSNEVTFGGAVPFTGDSNTTVDLATNTVQVQLDNSSTDFQPGGKTITFNGVTNPVASSASSGSFTITTYNPIQPTPPAPSVDSGKLGDWGGVTKPSKSSSSPQCACSMCPSCAHRGVEESGVAGRPAGVCDWIP